VSEPRGATRATAIAVALAVASVGVPSCAGVLDVDASKYADAIGEICGCSVAERAMPGGDCRERLRARFDAAGGEAVSRWLDAYEARACSECDGAASCFYDAPSCSTGACVTNEECCGADSKVKRCAFVDGVGTCAACKPVTADCATHDECCGGTGLGYCAKPTGEEKGFCVEKCDANDPWNCPGCCQRVVLADGTKLDLCADKTPGVTCAPHCGGELDTVSCAKLARCKSQTLDVSGVGRAHVFGCL
jgi:hypothetical protein